MNPIKYIKKRRKINQLKVTEIAILKIIEYSRIFNPKALDYFINRLKEVEKDFKELTGFTFTEYYLKKM